MYADFSKFDDFNLEEKAKQVPSQKQFWASRLIDAKRDKAKLMKQKKLIRDSLTDKLGSQNVVRLDKHSIDQQIENAPSMDELNDRIAENGFLIEFLEMIFKCVQFIAQDIKNIVDIRRIETGDY